MEWENTVMCKTKQECSRDEKNLLHRTFCEAELTSSSPCYCILTTYEEVWRIQKLVHCVVFLLDLTQTIIWLYFVNFPTYTLYIPVLSVMV